MGSWGPGRDPKCLGRYTVPSQIQPSSSLTVRRIALGYLTLPLRYPQSQGCDVVFNSYLEFGFRPSDEERILREKPPRCPLISAFRAQERGVVIREVKLETGATTNWSARCRFSGGADEGRYVKRRRQVQGD